MPRILILEDDPLLMKFLVLSLNQSGYETHSTSTIADALTSIRASSFDLLCFDLGLPDGCGLDLCERIRAEGDNTPILLISGRTDEETVVKGIKNGADDYLRKPFGLEEFKIRLKRLISKSSPATLPITFGPLTVDPKKRIVTIMNQIVILGRKEMEILIILAKKSGEVVSRELILNAVYDRCDLYDRTVDSHMSHLRKKLKEASDQSIQINSVYGLGYRLELK